jgi:hypothetical protein
VVPRPGARAHLRGRDEEVSTRARTRACVRVVVAAADTAAMARSLLSFHRKCHLKNLVLEFVRNHLDESEIEILEARSRPALERGRCAVVA